ncbi:hypothetical protein HPLT_08190 [Helicobacter pylori Lithuania75]|nr:hypothetical protein HPLT_08190 [Helicobacter pylori Lithuania75]
MFLCLEWFCVWSGCYHSLILVARVFGFNFLDTAWLAIAWVIAWLVFSFDEKND